MIATPQIVTTAFQTAESPPCAPFKTAQPNLDTNNMIDTHQDNVSKKLTYEERDSGTLMFSIDDVVIEN